MDDINNIITFASELRTKQQKKYYNEKVFSNGRCRNDGNNECKCTE